MTRLAGYQQQVHAALANAGENLAHVRAWQQAANPARWRRQNLLVMGGFAALLVAGALAALLLMLLDLGEFFGWLTVVVPLGFMALPVIVALASARAREKATASAGSHTVACPSCGAPNQMTVGRALDRCRYCQSALVASEKLALAGIEAADAVRRAAAFERHRVERRGTLQITSMNMSTSASFLPFIVVGSISVPLGIGAVLTTFGMLFGSVPASFPALFAIWGSLFALLAGAATAWQLRSLRKSRFQRVLDDLSLQIGGQRTESIIPVVDWLNHHWPADYNLAWLRAGVYHGAAIGHVHGLPCIIHLDLRAADSSHAAHVILVIAAWLPAARHEKARMDPNALACSEWLERAGFFVRIEECGVMAVANERALMSIRNEPTLAHMLITVLTTLSGLTRVLRNAPSSAAPIAPAAQLR
jgi:hypothetical protein